MSRYTVLLHEGPLNDHSHQVDLTLNDPLVGDNTWSISTPNSWIGTGSGTYTVATKIEKALYLLTAVASGGVRFELAMEDYPHSLETGKGGGAYKSASGSSALSWFSAATRGPQDIGPDPG